jgi:hypothetical protein
MLTCEVTTTYTDPLKIHDETAKHEAAARGKLGDCYMTGSQNTSVPDHDAGVPTGAHTYRVTTYWAQGIRPGSEPAATEE